MMSKQSDLYIFKQLPPEMLQKVLNFTVKLLVNEARKKEVKEDDKR